MVEWIKEYCLYIIIILFVLVMLQTCRSCTKDSTLQWSEMEKSVITDSLRRENNIKSKRIDSLTYELNKLQNKYEASQSKIEELKRDKDYLKDQNKTLNNNLKKSLDNNEKSE